MIREIVLKTVERVTGKRTDSPTNRWTFFRGTGPNSQDEGLARLAASNIRAGATQYEEPRHLGLRRQGRRPGKFIALDALFSSRFLSVVNPVQKFNEPLTVNPE